jgi:hypothetical protein
MASRGFTVLRPGVAYDRHIENYFNFLLGRDPCNPIFKNTFFMRPCYNYRNVHSTSPSRAYRQNFCGVTPELCKTSPSLVYSEGTPDTPYPLRNGVKEVFIPVLCTLVTDDEIGADGQTIPQLDILRAENDIVTPRDVRATIQVGSGQKEDIVPDLLAYRKRTDSPFVLTVPNDSTLADFMEFEVRRGTHNRALSEGYFLVLEFDTRGIYHLEAEGYGVRGHVSLMNYYIQY